MITIDITQKMRDRASEWAGKVSKTTTLRNKENYTGLVAKDRYFCGYLGELVFLEYLKGQGKKARYKVKTNGRSDSGDFVMAGVVTGQTKTIDVKTACKSFHEKIMLPESQLKKHQRDYYVGVRLSDTIGEIWGYCLAKHFIVEEFGFNSSQVVTCYKELEDLRPIESMMKLLKEGEIRFD